MRARVQPFALASKVLLQADVKLAAMLAIEEAIAEEPARLIEDGPTADKLAQAVTTGAPQSSG